MSCPPAETIQDLLDGRLTADARAELLAHADGCPGCHDLVVELVRETGAPSPLADTALAPEDTLRERAAARLVPGEAVGPFIVIDEIGAGGMGVVVSAYDPRLERRVAIKVVRPGHGDAAAHRARLMREAQAMARLSHPHVITVYEVGARGGARGARSSPPSRAWAAAWPRRTRPASSTAISSRTTSSSERTGGSGSPTSGWWA